MGWLRIAALGAALGAACGEHTPSDHDPEAVAACDQYAHVVSRAFADCDLGTYEENVQAFEDALPEGDCDGADGIGDQTSLEGECLPFFRDSGCDVLGAPDIEDRIPDSCRGQILFDE